MKMRALKNIIVSFTAAFSMYSRIPMPVIKWTEENIKYTFFFFPFVGAVEGVIFFFLSRFLAAAGAGTLLAGALLTAFTFLYTGGIHADGFLDVCDALGSYKEKEERRKILKDPHVGSAAVISGIVLCILKTAVYGGAGTLLSLFIALSFFLSRILSALSIMFFPEAVKEGLAFSFKKAAGKAVKPLLVLLAVSAFGAAFYLSVKAAVVLIVASVVLFIYQGTI